MSGRTGAIRQEALKTQDFHAAERHGKRNDKTSQQRRVRDVPPLVYGSLNLKKAQQEHMKGVQQQGKTAALHMLVQFPTDIPLNERKERMMLDHAVRFANQYHGGDAVFAARLDRDEEGRHTVDVFLMPRHDFTYKDGRTQKRASVSKHSKEQAKARFGKDDPRSQGRALQAAWYEYLRDELNLDGWVKPPEPKKSRTKDRLEPEEYKLQQEKQKAEAEALMMTAAAEQDAAKIRAKGRQEVIWALEAVKKRSDAVEAREKAVERDAAIVAAARRSIGQPAPEIDVIAVRRRQRPDDEQQH